MIIITRTATALAAACVTNINEVMKHMMCLHKHSQPSASFTLSSAASPNSFTLASALAKAFLTASFSAIFATIGLLAIYCAIGCDFTKFLTLLKSFHWESSKASSLADSFCNWADST